MFGWRLLDGLLGWKLMLAHDSRRLFAPPFFKGEAGWGSGFGFNSLNHNFNLMDYI
jgi:hypothetical protein